MQDQEVIEQAEAVLNSLRLRGAEREEWRGVAVAAVLKASATAERGERFSAWWTRYLAARREVIREMRRERLQRGNREGFYPDDLPAADVAVDLGDAEAVEAVGERMKRLTAREAEVIRLRFWEGMSLSEIAKRLGRSKTLVHSILHSALGRLRAPAL
jgi:RNA polymerase sigma factor (sigma-70 family)